MPFCFCIFICARLILLHLFVCLLYLPFTVVFWFCCLCAIVTALLLFVLHPFSMTALLLFGLVCFPAFRNRILIYFTVPWLAAPLPLQQSAPYAVLSYFATTTTTVLLEAFRVVRFTYSLLSHTHTHTHNRSNFRPPTSMHCFQLRFSNSPRSLTSPLRIIFFYTPLYLYIILSVKKATAFTGICIYNYCTCVLHSGKPLSFVGFGGCAGGLCAGFGCAFVGVRY